jgi:hypothetical protein
LSFRYLRRPLHLSALYNVTDHAGFPPFSPDPEGSCVGHSVHLLLSFFVDDCLQRSAALSSPSLRSPLFHTLSHSDTPLALLAHNNKRIKRTRKQRPACAILHAATLAGSSRPTIPVRTRRSSTKKLWPSIGNLTRTMLLGYRAITRLIAH